MSRCRSFPATKLVPLLRAIADPEGIGALTREHADTFRQVEANLNRTCRGRSQETARSAWLPSAALRRIVREAPADADLLDDLAVVRAPLVEDEGEAI
jgi:hypothetical protein